MACSPPPHHPPVPPPRRRERRAAPGGRGLGWTGLGRGGGLQRCVRGTVSVDRFPYRARVCFFFFLVPHVVVACVPAPPPASCPLPPVSTRPTDADERAMAATLSARTAAAAAVLATRYRPPTTAIKPPRKSGDHPEIYPLVAAVSVGLCLAVFEAARTLFLCPTVKLNKAERSASARPPRGARRAAGLAGPDWRGGRAARLATSHSVLTQPPAARPRARLAPVLECADSPEAGARCGRGWRGCTPSAYPWTVLPHSCTVLAHHPPPPPPRQHAAT